MKYNITNSKNWTLPQPLPIPTGFRMCASFSLPLPKLDEGRPPFIPGQHHAQSRLEKESRL